MICLQAMEDLLYDSYSIEPNVLVVAPLRVARDTWPAELKKWDQISDLTMSVMVGDSQTRIRALRKEADIHVINRENLQWLVDYLQDHKMKWPFETVILDELSSFKNHKSQRFKALTRVRPFVKRVIGLTGTPASNGLMDLWAEVKAVDGGKRLGRFIGRYREAFFKPAAMNPYTGVVYNYVIRPGAEKQIYKRIDDITISMSSKDYLPDLPKAIFIDHEVEMSNSEREVYDQMKKDLVATVDDEEITAANAAVLSGKLLQMANGALYSDDGKVIDIHNRKLDMLCDLIEQANGQSVLIAYWYKHDHERILERLKKEGYQPRDLKSSKDLEDWNAGKIPVALISPASAGHGLNIQEGGHILIWYSMVWSLEMYQQTNARLNRQGQNHVVTIHHIICKDTVDEDVIEALKNKNTTQQGLINAVKVRIK